MPVQGVAGTEGAQVNICNQDRVANMVTVYLAHMIGLDMTKMITQYQYVDRERNLTHYPFFNGKYILLRFINHVL